MLLHIIGLLRECSPKDDNYDNKDVLTHLNESGNKWSFETMVGHEYEFNDGAEIVTRENIFTKFIPEQVGRLIKSYTHTQMLCHVLMFASFAVIYPLALSCWILEKMSWVISEHG